MRDELTVIKGESVTYTNKIINKLLAETSFLLVAFGFAELAVFWNSFPE